MTLYNAIDRTLEGPHFAVNTQLFIVYLQGYQIPFPVD